MAVWSTEAVIGFIRIFRQNTSLWKVKSKEYSNRHIKNMAYDELVNYCKQIGFASANRDFVTKKIQNLRGAFRKELKKLTEARKTGGSELVVKPSLWYFDLLYFTKDQEDDNKEEEAEPPERSDKSLQRHLSIASPTPIAEISSLPIRDDTAEESNEKPRKVLKRKAFVTDTQIKLMKVCTEALKRKEITEFEGIGISVAKKLEKMNSLQALYAESLIHSVLRKGLLNRLTEETDICDKQCNRNVQFSRPSPSTSSDHPNYYVIQNEDTGTAHTDPLITNLIGDSFVKVEQD
ncbi:uncharacterized protein LOC125235097 [Leguminivora glycinivorella]|uniref:uncharacterized protein LOC125235097 n=1 Tax=Leguminivora glycinivorella TaxID=1035111 RepID=UPI00200F7D80|nr:uncharacterized protein LOC125235097 [Leguminivora glycinivorella]